MKEELYQWIKNLAVFYILFTAVLHLVPDNKYERFVRAFMGLLLIFMLCTPVFALLGKSRELAETFAGFYQEETLELEQQEAENLQQIYIQSGYEQELKKKILNIFENTGIKLKDAAVHIEGEQAAVTLYVQESLTTEQERGIQDALWTDCGIGEENYQIMVDGTDGETVDHSTVSGTAAGSGSVAGVR